MPVMEYAPAQSRGVTTLMSVGRSDLGQDDAAQPRPLFTGVKTGLMVMGLATLLGASPSTARWAGVAGLGLGIVLSVR